MRLKLSMTDCNGNRWQLSFKATATLTLLSDGDNESSVNVSSADEIHSWDDALDWAESNTSDPDWVNWATSED